MRVDRLVNLLLSVFGNTSNGERRLRFHSQNLNEDRDGNVKGWPYEGRSWLSSQHRELRFEWNLWTHFCGVSAKIDGDTGGLTLHVAFPPFSFWLTLPIHFGMRRGRDVFFDLAVHGKALWWQFGGSSMEWSSRTPRWKHGCFHFDDFFLGKMAHSSRPLSTQGVVIPMPEGPYKASVVLEESVWKRSRWPFPIVRRTAKVDVPAGIPHQGKGENSWDCGEDALFGLSCEAWTVDEAVSKTVASVLRSRRRYDGDAMAVYPHPDVRQAVAQ